MTRQTTERYRALVYDGDALRTARGDQVVPRVAPADVGMAALQLVPAGEPVVWHWGPADRDTPAAIGELCGGFAERQGGGGWWVQTLAGRRAHLAFPATLGAFADASSPAVLGEAVEAWRTSVGFAFLYSAASTLHALIRTTGTIPAPAEPDPEPPGWSASAWAVPAHAWTGALDLDVLAALGCRYVRCFDRSGSYLSAWSSAMLPAGGWTYVPKVRAVPGPEREKPPGYWLAQRSALPAGDGSFCPWDRQDDAPHVWLTTPLVQLAVDIAGGPVEFDGAYLAARTCRPLDPAARRLSTARSALLAQSTEATMLGEACALALDVLKDGYAGAVAWMEYGPKYPAPLARPSWRHTIIDRYVANTWRALSKATPGPFALADIDCALFALRNPDGKPDLRDGGGLGSWKPKGDAIDIDRAAELYAAGGPRAVIAEAESRGADTTGGINV